jgi:hypothetical protein
MANTIIAGNATNNGLAFSSDSTGVLNILTGTGSGTTALSIDASQNVTVTGSITATGGANNGIKAWVNFNGATAGTNTPRASFNVTSVTKNSAADYTINFTSAFSNTNYIMVGSIASNVAFSSTMPIIKSATQLGAPSNKTTSVCQILTPNYSGALTDNVTEVYCAFIGT